MDPTSQRALVIIAAALSIQTLLMIGAVVAAAIGWKRMSAAVDLRLRALEEHFNDFNSRLDELSRHVRTAVQTVAHWSDQASGLADEAGNVVRSMASAVAAPRALLMAGAATAASKILSRWRRSRRQAVSA